MTTNRGRPDDPGRLLDADCQRAIDCDDLLEERKKAAAHLGQSIVTLRRLANRSNDDEAQSAALYLAGELQKLLPTVESVEKRL